MNFSQIIKELREETGLSQKALSEKIGISSSGIGHLELAQREPSSSSILAYAEFFNVSADYLLGLADDYGSRVPSTSTTTSAAAMNDNLTEKEKALLEAFSKLLPETQDFVLRSVQSMDNKKTVT